MEKTDRAYRKLKLDNGHDIHVSADDGYVHANIGHGLLSAEFRMQAADAELFGQALLDVAATPGELNEASLEAALVNIDVAKHKAVGLLYRLVHQIEQGDFRDEQGNPLRNNVHFIRAKEAVGE